MKKLLIILSVYCGLAIGLWGANAGHEDRDLADDHAQHAANPDEGYTEQDCGCPNCQNPGGDDKQNAQNDEPDPHAAGQDDDHHV